jgi:PAS domain S-box-containing protein
LSAELVTPIAPGFDALVFKARRGIEDIYELTYIRKDGSRLPAVVSVTALRDADNKVIGYLLIGTDNTARKQVEEAMRKSEERYSTIFDTMSEGFCIIEVVFDADNKATDYRLLETNKAFEVQSGLLNAKGKWMSELQPAHEAHWFELYGKVALTGEPAHIENEAKALNRWFEVSAHRFGDVSSRNVSIFFQDISERKKGEAAKLKSEALQRAIFESANFSSIATDARGVIQIFNVGAERMLGYAAADVMNKITPADISDPLELIGRAKQLSAELNIPIAPGFEAMVFKASRGIEDIYELTYIRKDGSRLPAVVSVTALRDAQDAIIGYLLIGTDNTARQQADDKAQTAAQHARSLIEASLDPLVTISPMGKITDLNEGLVSVTGVKRKKLIGTDFSDYFTDPKMAREGYLEAFLKGAVTDYPLTIQHKNGRLTDVLYNASVYKDVEGRVLGVFAAARDVTRHNLAEAEHRRLNAVLEDSMQELKKAKVAADEANLAKSDFLSSMSHELRSPLNAILGFAQLIESGTPPPNVAQADGIKQILQAGWYLLELINEILDLALIESGKLSLSLEPVSLTEVLADCQAMIEPEAHKSGIQVLFPRPEGTCVVVADRTRVKQVLLNLLSNAIKYNRVRGRVDVRCEADASGRTRISVQDTGEGLSADKLSQLFQSFNRLGQETGNQEGTGIGLVTSKRLVDLMGGRIGVDSSVGVGSVFWFEFDSSAAPQPKAEPPYVSMTSARSAVSGAAQRTLLCVEDNPANLLLVQRMLERRTDIRMLSANDGQRGVEMARAHQPDVILMDINLPGINGITALRILAEDAVTAHIPVVALSANAMRHDIEKGLQAGFFRYLTKPIKLTEFMNTLDAALAQTTQTTQTGEIE